jgi:hypothetical protein
MAAMRTFVRHDRLLAEFLDVTFMESPEEAQDDSDLRSDLRSPCRGSSRFESEL